MNLNQAVNKLSWKFRNQKTFKVYREDIESWNKVLEALNGHVNSKVQKNQIAAKFIIEHYKQLIQYYDSDVFSDIPIKELSKIADKPIDRHIQEFTEFLNNREIIRWSDQLTKENIQSMSKDDVSSELKKMQEAGHSFTIEIVETNLAQIISELIRCYEK